MMLSNRLALCQLLCLSMVSAQADVKRVLIVAPSNEQEVTPSIRRRNLQSCIAPTSTSDYDCSVEKCAPCCWYDSEDLTIAFGTPEEFNPEVTPFDHILKKCHVGEDDKCYCGPKSTEPAPLPSLTDPTTTSSEGQCVAPTGEFDCAEYKAAGATDACAPCCWFDSSLTLTSPVYQEDSTNTKKCYKKGDGSSAQCFCGPAPAPAPTPVASPASSPVAAPVDTSCNGKIGDEISCSAMSPGVCGECCWYDLTTDPSNIQYSPDWSQLAKPELECNKLTFTNGDAPKCLCGPAPGAL